MLTKTCKRERLAEPLFVNHGKMQMSCRLPVPRQVLPRSRLSVSFLNNCVLTLYLVDICMLTSTLIFIASLLLTSAFV